MNENDTIGYEVYTARLFDSVAVPTSASLSAASKQHEQEPWHRDAIADDESAVME